MTWSLALTLAERMSMVATAAFILSRTAFFQRILYKQLTGRDRLILALTGGGLGIVGTYAGISIHGALANSRVIGVMVAGLLGGPLVGFTAGLLAGVHRYLLGGFTAFSCALAAVAEGTMGGLVQQHYRRSPVSWPAALLTGLAGEVMQMVIILLTAQPFSEAWELVKIIGLPMIAVNSVGIAIFMVIVKTAGEQRERIAACQAQQALRIATRTLPYLRRGLNQESALETARIIYHSVKVAAVAITDQNQILAHVGMGADHHHPGNPILTAATRRSMETGLCQLAQTRAEIGCQHKQCRLASAVVVPLKRREKIIGSLKLYHDRENSINAVDLELIQGLAHLFSTQLELAELEHQAQLRARAELKALQAQVHPHFLFNALNAIVSLIRLRPDTARELLIRLADFLRYSLKRDDSPITLQEELDHVDAYLAIEGARFDDKLKVVRKIEPAALTCPVPPFTLQPVVENAVKHGLQPKPGGGQVEIVVEEQAEEIKVTVRDNGVGMPGRELTRILEPGYGHGNGLGLSLVNERMKSLYGENYALQITSSPGRGTAVVLRFPKDADTEGVGVYALHRYCG